MRPEVRRELGVALDDPLARARVPANVGAMDHAIAAEPRPELRVVRDVVLVGEHHGANAAERRDPLDEDLGEPRRIDQHVAVRSPDQVARGAIRRLARIAAERHVAEQRLGERAGRGAHVVLAARADRARRAGHQRHPRTMPTGRRRLGRDDRLRGSVIAREHLRCDLAAQVAVDARAVDEEVATDVRCDRIGLACHGSV